MSYQHICICWNLGNILCLPFCNTILYKHRHPVKLDPIDLNARVAKVMHILIQSVDLGSIQAAVMISAHKNLVSIRQVAKLVQKIDGFGFRTNHAEIARMHYDVGHRKSLQLPMVSVGIR